MIAFILLSLVIVALAAISCIPGVQALYPSLPMILLWGATGIAGLYYIVRRRLYRNGVLFLLHAAFLVILAGAAITHFTATSDTLALRLGQTAECRGMAITLEDFRVEYYPGTSAPQDFVSTIDVDGTRMTVSMNRVAAAGGCRIFQTSYDSDLGGSVLTVAGDAAGTATTYAGYIMLFTAMALWLVVRPRGRRTVAAAMLAFAALGAQAQPQAVPAELASDIGGLFVYHNGRIAPLSTLADDFTRKLTGSPTYCGLSAEQVLTGWLFYYDSWKSEPCIAIKDKDTRTELGSAHAALTDFFDGSGYRFDDSRHAEANEKFAVASSAATGSLWKIFPCAAGSDSTLVWLSPVDNMPEDMPLADWHIARHSLNYLAQLVAERRWDEARRVVGQLSGFQHRNAGPFLPTPAQVRCERLYMDMAATPWLAACLLVAGLFFLIFARTRVALSVAIAGWLAVGLMIALNWLASGHAPCSNGEETMQLMAFCALTVCVALRRRSPSMPPLGMIVAALALFVSLMGRRTPQVTQLMPVLNSPLLSLHVLVIMLAYALLALMALSGAMWLCGRRDMLAVARRLLCPAVFLLAAGIFIGAVWANKSWGRYWGWDPKEVWALITMLVYTFPLHRGIVRVLARDRAFAIFCVLAFLSVLMTYFGVNFFLGGLHAYS